MNLRILKKLSKRAAPLLAQLGDRREQFAARKDENYHGILILARKHWERGRSVHPDVGRDLEIKTPAADGKGWVYLHPPYHPRKGTIMVGAVSGYYEPEWDEECAWTALENIVYWHFTDYDPETEDLVPTRFFRTPRDLLAAAREIIAEGDKGWCINHPSRKAREILDGEPLCQACCDDWVRSEGAAFQEREAMEEADFQ